MKSKLVVCLFPLGLTVLACCAGSGCSSSSSGTAVNEAGTTEAGGNPEGGTPGDTGSQDAPITKPDAAITGPFVQLEYGVANCPGFTKCDSDPKGTWLVKGGCVLESIFDDAKAQCPGIVESNVKFEARGNVIADALTISRNTEVKFTASFFVPASCVSLAGGSCTTIATLLKSGGLMTATCMTSATAGACDCDIGDQITDSLAAESYTTSGGTLTTGGGKKYDYCVAGSEITYKETTATKAIPAILVLDKQ